MKILILGDTHGVDDLFATIKRTEAPFEMLLHVGDVEGERRFFFVRFFLWAFGLCAEVLN